MNKRTPKVGERFIYGREKNSGRTGWVGTVTRVRNGRVGVLYDNGVNEDYSVSAFDCFMHDRHSDSDGRGYLKILGEEMEHTNFILIAEKHGYKAEHVDGDVKEAVEKAKDMAHEFNCKVSIYKRVLEVKPTRNVTVSKV